MTIRSVAIGVLLAGLLLSGCDGEPAPPDECANDEFPEDAFATISAANLGRFSLRDRHEVTGDPVSGYTVTSRGLVSALFEDITAVNTGTIPSVGFVETMSCIGITGLRVTTGDPVPLDVTSVAVSGDGLVSPIDLVSPGQGLWNTGMPLDMAVLVGAGLTLDVLGGSNMGEFPSFSVDLSVPADPIIGFPDLTGPIALDIATDMVIEWEPGDADSDLIEISVDPVLPPGDTRIWRLLCYTRDDGCHTLPAEVLQWVTFIETQDFQFEFVRHRSSVSDLGPNPGDNVVITDLSGSHIAPATR